MFMENADLKRPPLAVNVSIYILAVLNLLFLHIERICACMCDGVCVFV